MGIWQRLRRHRRCRGEPLHYQRSLRRRTASFNGLEYIASYGDLIGAFGANEDSGASHYITNGRFEGRTTSFNGLEYIASTAT